MLLLGHIGITCGVALAAEAVAVQRGQSPDLPAGVAARLRQATASLSRRVDLRVLAVAALLPDIIDKPLGMVLLADTLGSGRLFCHALIFPVVLAAAGALQWRARRVSALLILAYGSFLHLVLDGMWRNPDVLFWPFTRMPVQAASSHDWLARVLQELITNPAAYVPEIVGATMLLPLIFAILKGTGPVRFLRSGTVELH